MTQRDLIDDLRRRINPAYATTLGTESYDRRLCAEALEAQADEIERLRNALLLAKIQGSKADRDRIIDEALVTPNDRHNWPQKAAPGGNDEH